MQSKARGYHHGQLREALVEAGFRLARSAGPEAVVLRAVSREAGVSHNAAYRHFADHEDLLAAVSQRCMEQIADLMSKRAAEVRRRAAVPRAWARLRAIGGAYIEFARTEPGWFRTAFAGARHGADKQAALKGPPTADDGGGADVTDPALPGPFRLLIGCLDELVTVGALPPERRPGAEHAAWATVHGLSCLLVDGPLRDLPDDQVQIVTDKVLSVAEAGL